jgi:hypothetical protein
LVFRHYGIGELGAAPAEDAGSAAASDPTPEPKAAAAKTGAAKAGATKPSTAKPGGAAAAKA